MEWEGGMEGGREGGCRIKRTNCPVTVQAALVLGELKGVPDATRLHIRAQDLVHGHAGHATSYLSEEEKEEDGGGSKMISESISATGTDNLITIRLTKHTGQWTCTQS